jgi:site-specific recombinase XerC
MHDLVYDLKRLAERHREGSFATQANRKQMLTLFGEQLWQAGFRHMRATDLKGRHVNRLLALWREQALSPATLRNRLSVLRWWAEKVDRVGVVAASNAMYGIPTRQTVARVSKAMALPSDKLTRLADPYVRLSLELQRAFGLRREESIKIKPHQADQGNRLVLQGSWTKGGRPREIPIRTAAQREVLNRAKALVQGITGALIPPGKRYVEQLRRYEHWTARVGLNKMHGLRHAYAQDRFLELTGFPCPAAGGPAREALTPAQREADADARMLISVELGHGREAITVVYLGR